MKHPSIHEVYDYWNARRGLHRAPERSDIEPGAIRRALADTFILAYEARSDHPFRIAGTRVCAAFARELKGEPFIGLWAAASQAQLRHLLHIVAQEAVGVVASATAESAAGDPLNIEVLLLPLCHRGRSDARVLGALAPIETPHWLGTESLGALALGTLRYLNPEHATPVAMGTAPALATGRLRRGFVVYEGGKPNPASPSLLTPR